MAEQSSFKAGSGSSSVQNKPKKEDSAPVDEYYGRYKDTAAGVSENERFGTSDNPVQNDSLPAKNLRTVGG